MTGPPFRHVVRAKLVPARIPEGLVTRDRLLRQFSIDHRFTLVSAMPGYGKTAAVRQWIDSVKIPVAWLSLDLLDNDPVSFWSNVLLALGSAVPGIEAEPGMLLWERGVEDGLFLSALVAGLAEAEGPIVLVLDGLAADLDRATVAGLAVLVERAGDTVRVVATTRTDPPLPLARWRSFGWLNDIREDSLRLTDEEALAIARRADTSIRDDADVLALNHRVAGWPIGLHMALLSRPAGGRSESSGDLGSGTERLLSNYLVAEVLAALSDEERDVALALSVLEWFDPDISAELVGPHAARVVRQLLGRGMFLSVVDPQSGSMRFHDLFRELMELELGWRDPAARLDLHRRAAMLWRGRGDLMSAYHHLSAIGEQDKARDLLVGPALDLVDRGDLHTLHQYARRLPTQHHVTNASLALDLAVVSLFADGTRPARRWYDRATVLFDDAASVVGDDIGDDVRGRFVGLDCWLALLDADLDGALASVDSYDALASGSTGEFERRFPIVAARVMLAARRRTEAELWIGLAQRLDGPPIVAEVTVPTLQAWYEWMFGDLGRAVTLIDAALGWMAEHRIGAHHHAFDTLITGAWCLLSVGDVLAATALAERAWADAATLGCAWNQLQAGYLGARLAVVTGDPVRCLRLVEELREVISFQACRPYADRLIGVEVEGLAAVGRTTEAARMIEALEPGPRALLLRARLGGASDRDVADLLAQRASWPVLERIQAELVLNVRANGSVPSEQLVELVRDCGISGWVLPFLGLGPRIERLLRSTRLAEAHPRLARTLDYLAPVDPIGDPDRAGIRLTSRELSLVELLPTHLSYAEIGARLYLSVNTVKSNLKSVYRKLDVTTRAEAVEASRRSGLI